MLEALLIALFVFALALGAGAAADARPASASAGTATVSRSEPTTGLDLTWVENSPVLRYGDEGAAVTEWQTLMARWLAAKPIVDPWHFSIDGVFGPITDGVTRSFQFAQDLPIDGIVGPATPCRVSERAVARGDQVGLGTRRHRARPRHVGPRGRGLAGEPEHLVRSSR